MGRRLSLFLFAAFAACQQASGVAQEIPLVYDVEHRSSAAQTTLPNMDQLPQVRPLPDPFAWSDGSGRSTDFDDWRRRRHEIKSEIEHYGIGRKPPAPQQLTSSYEDGLLTVEMMHQGEALTLTARVRLPQGEGPFPAVIGIGFGGGSGSLPADIFEDRRIAQIAFNFAQVMSHTQTRGREPINRLYPEHTAIGAYSAWPWGISRLIDGLELVQQELPIDLEHLAVTGCSFAGKMALFAGALDERIALTIAQEPGGGGAAAWRVSETLGNVETLGRTSRAWFLEDMFRFANQVERLPYDHHELMALVAPRALLVLGNPDYEWLADESGYVSCRAAQEVWKAFGVADRFGFSIVAGHPHCQLPASQRPEVEAFVDKFLLGRQAIETSVAKHPFGDLEYEFWYDGWAKGHSTFPDPESENVVSIYLQAEDAELGASWKVLADEQATGGSYAAIASGLNATDAPPEDSSGGMRLPFQVDQTGNYFLYVRAQCPTADDDSFWFAIDDHDFAAANGLQTDGWQWVRIKGFQLTAGKHQLRIAYREDGALLDEICITNYLFGPTRGHSAQ